MEASARFDDVRTGTAFGLQGCQRELVARRADEVTAVIAGAQDAARAGSWVAGWVSYEAAPGLEPSLPAKPAGGLPLAWFGVFDRRVEVAAGVADTFAWVLDASQEWHARAVEDVRCRIAAGQTYQVNLTARAHACVDDPERLYRGLVRAQGGAYNALIVTPTHAVACASPELFFEVDSGRIVTRPMKGTASRGRWPEEDHAHADALRASPKERAENVMIVDLLRNDIGRIAEYDSVRVPALFEVERYPTMWQLTSTVEGRLRPGTTLVEIFAALFPSGSVTGAPKRAAMQAIAALEPSPRGVYCGAVGVCAPGAELRARFAVAIRTATVDLASGATEYGTGGGITWSSEPSAEWDELVAKTAILRGSPEVSGLFETFRSDSPNVPRHLARMAASADYFDIPFDRDRAERLVERPAGERVRLALDGDGGLGIVVGALPSDSGPVRLGWADEPVDSGDVRLFHKVEGRERPTRSGLDDLILVNERDEVTETTTCNLAVRLEGRWWTPALACGLLPGVERARLIDDGTLTERVIHRDEIDRATELAVVNSLRGWRQGILRP
ncbi:MAG: chorismate-binding protein [Acidimicrobiales bacterium]